MSSRGQVWIPAPRRNLNGQTVQFKGANPDELLAALTTFACFACHVTDSFKEAVTYLEGKAATPFSPLRGETLTAGLATTFHFLVHIVLLLSAVNFTGLLSRLSGGAYPHINILVLQSATSATGFFSAQFFGGNARLVSLWGEW